MTWGLTATVQLDYANGDQLAYIWKASGIVVRFGTSCLWSPLGQPTSFAFENYWNVGGQTGNGSCSATDVVFDDPNLYAIGSLSCNVYPQGTLPPPSSPTPTYWTSAINSFPVTIEVGACPGVSWPGGSAPPSVPLKFSRPSSCPGQAVLQWVRGNGCWIALPGGGIGSCSSGGATTFVDIAVGFA